MTTARTRSDPARESSLPAQDEHANAAGVLILGMHRSGTSAVAGVFRAAGLHVGSTADVMPPTDDNPLGYHERVSVVAENDRLLAQVGATWERPPVPGALATLRQHESSKVSALLRGLLGEDPMRPLVLKDPRIGILLPVWKPAYSGVLSPVLTVRHPLEIARSLLVRDGMPLAAGLALWEIYLSAILDAHHGESLAVAHVHHLLTTPGAAAALVDATCSGLQHSRTGLLEPDKAETSLDSSLRREHALPEEARDYLTLRQLELWSFLRELPTECKSLEAPTELRRPSEAALVTTEHLWRQRGRLVELESHEEAFQRTNDALEASRAELAATSKLNAGLQIERDQRGQRITNLEREAERLRADAERALRAESERDMLQARAAEALNQLRAQAQLRAEERRAAQHLAEDLQSEALRWQSRAYELDQEILAIRRSHTWRVGRAILLPITALRARGRHRER